MAVKGVDEHAARREGRRLVDTSTQRRVHGSSGPHPAGPDHFAASPWASAAAAAA